MMDRRRLKRRPGTTDVELLRLLYGPPESEYVPLCDPRRLGACPCGESGEAGCAICAGRSGPADEDEPDLF